MTNKTDIKIETHWDKDVVPANIPKKRGLLIDISGVSEKVSERRPVNLSLVIDRSGSMARGRLEAAKEAARGVLERLGENDVLSLIVFDSEVSTLVSGVRLTSGGKSEVINVIERVHTGGTTNLAGGWLEGATRAGEVMDNMDFKTGHVVLLSDGHANVGIEDPAILRAHADEMARRGVTTSAVGIGSGYSPLQLDALSEGGLGRLHDAASPDEIIETILGELGEVLSVVATNVEVSLRWPRELRADLLADFRTTHEGNTMVVKLGQLLGGSRRTLPLMVDVPGLPVGEVMVLDIEVTGKHSESGDAIRGISATAKLVVVPPAESHAVERNQDVAERIARLWESTLGLDAMRLNERGDFVAAGALVRDTGDVLASYSIGTSAEESIRRNLDAAGRKVRSRWDGRSKRESMIAAKKFSKGERDHRSDPRGNWNDHL